MITRNDPNCNYLIGANKISSEPDGSLHEMNTVSVRLTLDYRYEDPAEPNRFLFRSDQYPYIMEVKTRGAHNMKVVWQRRPQAPR